MPWRKHLTIEFFGRGELPWASNRSRINGETFLGLLRNLGVDFGSLWGAECIPGDWPFCTGGIPQIQRILAAASKPGSVPRR